MQPPGWRGGSPGPRRAAHRCRGSASRERNHGVGDHPIPFRTRQLSPTSPKVLRRQAAGGQVVPLAGGAFLRSGRPDGTAGPADAAAPTGTRPCPLFGARRGAEAAWPRGGAIPGACRILADFLGRTCATKLYYYLDAHAGVFLLQRADILSDKNSWLLRDSICWEGGLAWHARGNLRVERVASVA